MVLHGTGEDALFDVTALADQINGRVGMADMFDILGNDRALIKIRRLAT